MINTKRIYLSIFITCISFMLFVFLMGKIVTSDTFVHITKVHIAFYELFNDFMLYLLMDLFGLVLAICLMVLFVKKVKNSEDPSVILKMKVNSFKKEVAFVSLIIVCLLIVGIFVEKLYYFNMLFIPISNVFILTAFVFIIMMDKYVLRK